VDTGTNPKVVSIVGPGRSGSTILAGILGEVPGVLSAGELRWLWRRGLLDRRPCGCGLAPSDCPVWSRVVAMVAGEQGRQDPAASSVVRGVIAAQEELEARRNRMRVLRTAAGDSEGWQALTELRRITAQSCHALAEVTGDRVIVDTSKRAEEAAVLAGAPDVDHYVVHLVRDPRAVAYSWQRTRKSTPDGNRTMQIRGPLSSVTRWTENCLSAEYLRRQIPAKRWFSLRYEDFAARPRETVDRVLAFVGVDGPSPFLADDTVELHGNHIVAGNPSRFRTGSVRIVEDDEWARKLRPGDRWCVQSIAMPLMWRYGYPLRLPATT
jgi:hypothetical protein